MTTKFLDSRIFALMKRVISGFMLMVLVAVTIGIPVFRHTCHVFDRSDISFLSQDACCEPGEQNSAATIDFKCCSLEQFDTALDYETLVKKSADFSIDLFTGATEVSVISSPITIIDQSLPVLRPPPLANRTLLNKIQVYLI